VTVGKTNNKVKTPRKELHSSGTVVGLRQGDTLYKFLFYLDVGRVITNMETNAGEEYKREQDSVSCMQTIL
jgi:hypothetical protein